MTDNIARYCSWTSELSSEQLGQCIQKVFRGKDGAEMATVITKGIIQEGIEIGETKGQVKLIIDFLSERFTYVPPSIIASLNRVHSGAMLKMLVKRAIQCDSLDEFEDLL
ncbi:MAG: hypothetical protein LBU65_12620 [Planctomycetaceae bacterium]|nr:hypothetical protein [Planctomycetaceae bacterium]